MPYGRTFLGRQLRSVLAGLRRRPYHATHPHRRASAAAAVAQEDAWYDDDGPAAALQWQSEDRPPRETRRFKRQTRRDYLTEALLSTGQDSVAAVHYARKHDLSHQDPKRRDARTIARENAERHADDPRWPLADVETLALPRIVATHIQRSALPTSTTIEQSALDATPKLSRAEDAFLARLGYDAEDISAWAQIITMPDSYNAATALEDRAAQDGAKYLPLPILFYLLRRANISARALRVLINLSWQVMQERVSIMETRRLSENDAFILFVRLLRHAREVWPAAMEHITDLLLSTLPKTYSSGSNDTTRQTAALTYTLNKAMHLLSLRTAVEPYTDSVHQEASIVRILQYMASTEPQVQLNRGGYRAVIRIQLAQKKTPNEQQWAALKALSWPPWKQERTAMDALITPDEHGISRAGNTLRRMYEAGYAPLEWEKAAQLYAGWNTDGTPTIQSRTVHAPGPSHVHNEAAVWEARIGTTRTAQEAWAAWLSYEDSSQSPDRSVIFAILRKLSGEELRRRAVAAGRPWPQRSEDGERLYSGDTPDVEPLPPSTHLYTYIRTPVPSVATLLEQLHGRGVLLDPHTLAFVVANAPSLQLGFQYLTKTLGSAAAYSLVSTNKTDAAIPSLSPAFEAAIKLLCRYSSIPLTTLPRFHEIAPQNVNTTLIDRLELNGHHPLVHALELLRSRRTSSRPPWNAILRALSYDATLRSMRKLTPGNLGNRSDEAVTSGALTIMDRAKGAILADRLVRRTLALLQELHVDLDQTGVHNLCLVMENIGVACWAILLDEASRDGEGAVHWTSKEARDMVRSGSHARKLRGYFSLLVSGDDALEMLERNHGGAGQSADGTPAASLASLLHVPGAALLHAYVRGLGWMGDHEGILQLVRWMALHRAELREQRERDRNAKNAMRKCVVAIRVFLERSWLHGAHGAVPDVDAVGSSGEGSVPGWRGDLKRLVQPAPMVMIMEAEMIVNSVQDWRGWADDNDVQIYCQDERFRQIGEMCRGRE